MITKEEIERYLALYKQKSLTPEEEMELEELHQKHIKARDYLVVALMKDSAQLEAGVRMLDDNVVPNNELIQVMKKIIIFNGFITATLVGMFVSEYTTKNNIKPKNVFGTMEHFMKDVKPQKPH